VSTVTRTPGRLDYTVTRGDSFADSFTFSQSGAALNLTGYTFLAQLRAERSSSSTLLATFTVGTGSVATGVVAVSLTSGQLTVDPGRYWWELQWTTGSTVRTVLSGEFVVEPEVAAS
jgi:hypothetical protein